MLYFIYMFGKISNFVKENRNTSIVAIVVLIVLIACFFSVKATLDRNNQVESEKDALPPTFPVDKETGEVLDGQPKFESDGTLKGTNTQKVSSISAVENATGLKLSFPESWKVLDDIWIVKNAQPKSACVDGYECDESKNDEKSNTAHILFSTHNDTINEDILLEFYAQKVNDSNDINISGISIDSTVKQEVKTVSNTNITLYTSSTPYSLAVWKKDGVAYTLSSAGQNCSSSFLMTQVEKLFSALY